MAATWCYHYLLGGTTACSMDMPLKQKGQGLTATVMSQKLSANSLLFLWETEGRESFLTALNCFLLFNTPLGTTLYYT